MLPESLFNLGNVEIASDFNDGNFHVDEMRLAICKFKNMLQECGLDMNSVCSSLEPYYDKCCKCMTIL